MLCPASNPYVFMWGKYCCMYEEEDISVELIDGCDGGSISINSTCCKNNEHIKCMSEAGCHNRRGKHKPSNGLSILADTSDFI